jgi:hypothetical protein
MTLAETTGKEIIAEMVKQKIRVNDETVQDIVDCFPAQFDNLGSGVKEAYETALDKYAEKKYKEVTNGSR